MAVMNKLLSKLLILVQTTEYSRPNLLRILHAKRVIQEDMQLTHQIHFLGDEN